MFTLIGMVLCLSQSAMFSGLNLAVFGLSRLDLEVDSLAGGDDAKSILDLREDSNWTLCTILWGNVAVNVLLAMLADSALAGIASLRRSRRSCEHIACCCIRLPSRPLFFSIGGWARRTRPISPKNSCAA
jgi:CBS domain containing-hemolysin-like protein